ncbi:McrB family protein [Sinomicrobium sp. M5D2P9]
MNEQVLIYEVKSGAVNNAIQLFSSDSNYFYWNETKFKNLSLEDYVFIVNRTSRWILFTVLDKKGIVTQNDDSTTFFEDNNSSFRISGKWDEFIRLKILYKVDIPNDWQWQSLGSSEITYLFGPRINLKSSENRIKNIQQLKDLFDNYAKANGVLENCLAAFGSNYTPSIQFSHSEINKRDIPDKMKYENILTAIKTKPFILLAGISGTGKSRLVRTLAYKTCSEKSLRKEEKPGNFELIPVKPNWHDSSELLGYISRINGEKYVVTSFLKFIAKAWKYTEIPFFLCLDEMNLAPAEHYFAEYLSILETRKNKNGDIKTDFLLSKDMFDNERIYQQILKDLNLNDDGFKEGIPIPENLIVMGTVNMDETTHSFSRKVLDRAMTIEMNDIDLSRGLSMEYEDWSYPDDFLNKNHVVGSFTSGAEVYQQEDYRQKDEVLGFLKRINSILENSPFKIAYRVRDEFLIYCYYASKNKSGDNWLKEALDIMLLMKVLSRIEGDEIKTKHVLDKLLSELDVNYPKSASKVKEMLFKLNATGYTSPWS